MFKNYFLNLSNNLFGHNNDTNSKDNNNNSNNQIATSNSQYLVPSAYNKSVVYFNPYKLAQKLLIVRHAERVDSYYGLNWIENAFTYNGAYVRFDYNMPQDLIQRENPLDFEFDPPLTENGLQVRYYDYFDPN
jgi:hypothetical protein